MGLTSMMQASFREALHKDAWIFHFDKDGKFNNLLRDDEVFEGWANERGDPVQPRVISVNQTGDAANALLGFGEEWVDFHNLARINGVWKITSKTATDSSRVSPSWAKPKAER
jgi:Putative lumazine-binding